MVHNLLFLLFIFTFVVTVAFGASLFVSEFRVSNLLYFLLALTTSLILLLYSDAFANRNVTVETTLKKLLLGLIYALILTGLYSILYFGFEIQLPIIPTVLAVTVAIFSIKRYFKKRKNVTHLL